MQPEIDPELKYCPSCADEYRAEIGTCAACRLPLRTGAEMLAAEEARRRVEDAIRPGEILPGDPLVTVSRGPLLYIKGLRHALLGRGYPSLLARVEDGSCGSGCRGPELLLQVRQEDATMVMACLEEEHRRSTGLADQFVFSQETDARGEDTENLCPACGCVFSSRSLSCPDCGLCFH